MHNETLETDIAIFGSGIAGLWIGQTLRELGFSPLIFETEFLGGRQSIASQGMIHGGQRYALQGKLTEHSESIAAMPHIWTECLAGSRRPNLSSVKILSKQQYLWSPGGFGSQVASFFASKAMNSRVAALKRESYPEVFKRMRRFSGNVYELEEVVLDMQSVAQALSSDLETVKIDSLKISTSSGSTPSLEVQREDLPYQVKAQAYVFCAATGNEEPLRRLSGNASLTQRRPLKQVLVKTLDLPFYGHCITVDPRPRVTVSSHPLQDGKGYVWYLGGLVATHGIEKSDSEAIAFARAELEALFPDIDWKSKAWSTFSVDRAEPASKFGFLPDGPSFKRCQNNFLFAWPTKLTFAPALATKIVAEMKQLNVTPLKRKGYGLTPPQLAPYPWEHCSWN